MSDSSIENNLLDSDNSDSKGDRQENFAAMLDRSSMGRRLHPGQRIKAKVVSVSGDLVYIDLNGKSEGAVNLAEFVDEKGVAGVREGDEIEAFFVAVQDGLAKLTTLMGGYSAAKLSELRAAHESGIPVNGEVKREIKGGFEVSVGGVKGFCPFSHIDLKGGREGGIYPGRTFAFKVLEYEEGGKKFVLSRRALLEEERQANIEKLRENIAEGMVVPAEVKSIQKFGVFVDLGGIDGLIPLSEISWDRSVTPGDMLSERQKISAKVISLDWDHNRLTLSLKATQPDPWESAAEKYPVDSRVSGTVVRLSPFGAFVRLEPGVDGLIHISNLGAGRRINHPKEVVEVGQWIEVYVLSVDSRNRKMSLSAQPKVQPPKIVLPEIGELFDGTVERVMPYGVFLKMSNGLTGLISNVEMGTPRGTDHRRDFPPGTEMQVAVIDVDTTSNKIRLSRKAVLEKAAHDEFAEYKEIARNSSESSGGLGNIGDLLRAKQAANKDRG